MQVVLRVAADQFLVLGKGHVTFENASPHTGGGAVGFNGVFGELHRCAPMADRECSAFERTVGAGGQRVFERAFGHAINQVIGACANLYRTGRFGLNGARGRGKNSSDKQGGGIVHVTLRVVTETGRRRVSKRENHRFLTVW